MTARWGEGLWGEALWPTLSVADLLQQPPLPSHGVPTGIGDWKLSVELLLPADGLSMWGFGVWGVSEWNSLAWRDVTPWVRGLEWNRGQDQPYGRPRVGSLSVTLDSSEDQFDPWNPSPAATVDSMVLPLLDDDGDPLTDDDGDPLTMVGSGSVTFPVSYFSPGSIIRVGVRSATDGRVGGWLPQITAIVDTWGVRYVGPNRADRFVDITAFETVRDLAQIDDNALPGVVGGGETGLERFERLIAASGWKYGLIVEAQNILAGSYTLQSTDMANNRLTELYLTADSCDVHFRSDRTGAALVTNVEYASAPSTLPLWVFSRSGNFPAVSFMTTADYSATPYATIPYRADTVETGNNDDSIVNDARFARAGGLQQAYEQPASIARHGRRSLVRGDLLNTSDATVLQIAQYTTIRRGLNTLRVDAFTVSTSDIEHSSSDDIALSMLAVDVQSMAYFVPPGGTFAGPYIIGFVSNLSHRVTPRNGGEVTWETTVGLDTRTVMNLPVAQLPAS